MLTGDIKYLIGGALLQVVLLGVLAAVVHPQLTIQSLLCALLLLAAEFVVFREIRGMKTVSDRARRASAAPQRKR